MNSKGNFQIGAVFLLIGFILFLTLFATIEPFKEFLNTARAGNTGLNCPGTTSFNQTDYSDDNSLERLTRRPTCFVTGLSMIWFVWAFIFATVTWIISNWRKSRR